jgi:hypothetical protein
MMANIQRLKANTIQNGLLINADDFNAELDQLINKSNELDDAIYQNKTFTGNKTFNGTTAFQQDVTVNGTLNLSAGRQLLQWGGTETGTTKHIFEVNPSYAPNPLPDGYTVSFKISETPDAWEALSVKVGSNTALPLYKKQGQVLAGNAFVHGETITVQKTGSAFYVIGGVHLPLGYVHTPIPQYVSARTISMNGDAVARSSNYLRDLSATGNITISLDTTGLNGLSPTATLLPNTWYYLYLVDAGTTSSGGYVLHTSQGTLTFTINSVVHHARQLPLAIRTDASSNILPFRLLNWAARTSTLRYTTDLLISEFGLGTTPTKVGLVSSSTFSAFSLASFVPPSSRVAHLFCYSRGSGVLFMRETGGTQETRFYSNGTAIPFNPAIPTNASQSIEARVDSNGFDIAVEGFTMEL